jgi:hypothetical protein
MTVDEIGIRIAIGLGCFCLGFIIGMIVMFVKDTN